MTKSKKLCLGIWVITGVLLLTIFPAFSQQKQEEFSLRVGVIPLVEQIPLVVTQKDYFIKNSKIKLDVYDSWTALEAAFRTGAVGAAVITLPKALIMAYEGIPLKIVLVVNRNGSAFVSKSDSLKDLKGTIIGGSGNDTMDLVIFSKILKSQGLKLGYDVKYLLIPLKRATALLKEDRLFGFCLPEPYGAMAEKEGLVKKIVLSKDVYPNHIDSVLIVNPALLKKYPDQVKDYVSKIIKSAQFVEKDKDASKGKQSALAQADIFKLDPDLVCIALTKPKDRVLFNNFTPSATEIGEVQQALMELGAQGGAVKLNDIIETKYAE
ncbi:MAG: ABC transporter substrate-binding protein [Candidatus Omnitrophica bacterium]|nr:ABC transporter substrate-binding protein [Candidatus Omnitrophota bacterium]